MDIAKPKPVLYKALGSFGMRWTIEVIYNGLFKSIFISIITKILQGIIRGLSLSLPFEAPTRFGEGMSPLLPSKHHFADH